MEKQDVLRDRDLLVPVFLALKELGGIGTNTDISRRVIKDLQLSEAMLAVPHEAGRPRSELDYRMAWARTYLKKCGVIHSMGRATWAIAEDYAHVRYLDADILMSLAHGSGKIPSVSPDQHSRPWSRDETILALALYYQIPLGQWQEEHPAIVMLARRLRRRPVEIMLKLSAFAGVEKRTEARDSASPLEKDVWQEFSRRHWQLARKTDQLLHQGHSRTAEVAVRVGQDFFRNAVLSNYENRCCMTGIAIPTLLVASHIKPWAQSDDATEKVNPANGLCLNALHDKAFDQGLITLDAQYRIVVSEKLTTYPSLDETTKAWICRDAGKTIMLPERGKPSQLFLAYHRDCIFQRP